MFYSDRKSKVKVLPGYLHIVSKSTHIVSFSHTCIGDLRDFSGLQKETNQISEQQHQITQDNSDSP